MKLLYHALTAESQTSPFDLAILDAAKGQPIKIVSPYLGLSYLQRVIDNSTSWCLVSDVEEWLTAARKEREEAHAFIKNNLERIHHYPALHAKAVIGPHKAYLGSANLTASGIRLRTEVGVLVDDTVSVRELHDWFDGLWLQTEPPNLSELDAVFQQLMAQAGSKAASERKQKLRGRGIQIRAKLSAIPRSLPAEHPTSSDSRQDLVIEAIDVLADEGFTLKELLELVSDGSSSSRRRTLQVLYEQCANMVRSVYQLTAEPRLVLERDGYPFELRCARLRPCVFPRCMHD